MYILSWYSQRLLSRSLFKGHFSTVLDALVLSMTLSLLSFWTMRVGNDGICLFAFLVVVGFILFCFLRTEDLHIKVCVCLYMYPHMCMYFI